MHQKTCKENYGKTFREKLPSAQPITTHLIPTVQSFAVAEFGRGDPQVVLGPITEPTHKKLPSTAMASRVNDLIDPIFFEAIGSEDRTWLCKLS